MLLRQSQIAKDMSGQMVVDFAMTGNRLFLARLDVHINVMIAAGAEKHAALFLEPTKQVAPFHAISTSRI